MRAGDWTPVQWFNPILAQVANEISTLPKLAVSGDVCSLSNAPITVRVNFDYARSDDGDVFSTIAEDIMQTMRATPESKATPKRGHERKAKTIWEKATRFLIPAGFSTTSSRLLAIYSRNPAIGSLYYSMAVETIAQEKALTAFMNSSFGVIQMLNRRTRKLTYPRYEVGHLKTLMLPNPTTADLAPLLEAFEQVKDTPLERLSKCAKDPARQTLDHAAAKVLGIDPAVTDMWRKWLSQEPTISGKPAPA